MLSTETVRSIVLCIRAQASEKRTAKQCVILEDTSSGNCKFQALLRLPRIARPLRENQCSRCTSSRRNATTQLQYGTLSSSACHFGSTCRALVMCLAHSSLAIVASPKLVSACFRPSGSTMYSWIGLSPITKQSSGQDIGTYSLQEINPEAMYRTSVHPVASTQPTQMCACSETTSEAPVDEAPVDE